MRLAPDREETSQRGYVAVTIADGKPAGMATVNARQDLESSSLARTEEISGLGFDSLAAHQTP